MSTSQYLWRGLLAISLALTLISCSSSNSATGPDNSSGDYVTDASTMSPQPDSVMMEHLVDSSSFEVNRAYTKGADPNSLDDSLTLLVNSAIAMVRNKIPYVWGGRHIDRATKWFSDADAGGGGYDLPGSDHDNNSDCPSRIGLDCSGFVQTMFEKVGFGRHTPDLTVQQLTKASNWEFMEKRGYHAKNISLTAEMKPGDVLFFTNNKGEFSHMGIYAGTVTSRFGTGPAFIASAGYPDCDHNYQAESNGHPTGVSVSLLAGYWYPRIVSILRFTKEDSIQGSIRLHVSMGGSRSQQLGGMDEQRSEETTIDDSIYLKPVALQKYFANGGMGTWTASLSGSCLWTQTTKDTYPCNGGTASDITTETWTMNGPDLASQPFGVQFTIDSTGKYQFNVAPGINPQAKITHYHSEKEVGCGGTNPDPTDQDEGVVPFVQYLTPFSCGALGYFDGEQKTDQLQSSWECTDNYNVFNTGGTPLTIPVNVQVSWSFTIQ